MIKASAISIFLVCLLIALVCSSCKSPAKPEPPKPAANVQVEAKEIPIWFNPSSWGNYWYCNYTVLVSEHNGVGATVTTVKSVCKVGDRVIASLTESGGYLPPNGTLEVDCYIEVDEKHETMTITVEGTDSNGYSFMPSITYTWDWDSLALASINNCMPEK